MAIVEKTGGAEAASPVGGPDQSISLQDRQSYKSAEDTTILPCDKDGKSSEIDEQTGQNDLLRKLTQHMPGALFQFRLLTNGRFEATYLTEKFRVQTGLSHTNPEALALAHMKSVHPKDQSNYYSLLMKSCERLTTWEVDFRQRLSNKTYSWHRIWAKPELGTDGSIIFHGYVLDIDEQVKNLKKLETLAYQDSVTELPNRECFIQHIENLKSPKNINRQRMCSVCVVDLDNFKHFNDTYGHELGDKLLAQVGQRIHAVLPKSDFVARLGGDEFAICLHDLGTTEQESIEKTEAILRRLQEEMAAGFEIGVVTCAITASIGITIFSPDGERTTPDILKQVDMTMYEVKRSGKNNYLFHDSAAHHAKEDNFRVRSDLMIAAQRQEFKLEYQPQVDRLGKVVSCEALIRWDHPEFGRIMPDQFIKFAEENGQIEMINGWVIRSAIDTLATWKNDPLLRDIMISVNLNAVQLLDLGFAENLINYLPAREIDPSKLMIEITEHGAALEIGAVAKRMHELKENGIRFSLDDFGTGYSSLSQLQMLPVDELKIDGSFISTITENKDNANLVKAIFGMAEALSLKTVAEQVSTMEQFELLCKYNCDLFQGYLFSRSLDRKDFEEFVTATNGGGNRIGGRHPAREEMHTGSASA